MPKVEVGFCKVVAPTHLRMERGDTPEPEVPQSIEVLGLNGPGVRTGSWTGPSRVKGLQGYEFVRLYSG